jgi:transcriptional regulator with XRE-family HTH domain
VWSAVLIREARLRAGLTQQELADRSGRKRSVIARWERGAIEPSLETFLEIIGVCGFELPLELMARDDASYQRLHKNALLSPERRVQRLLKASVSDEPFDPYAILAALERRQTSYVVVGAFGRIVQGAEETTDGIDIAPSLRNANLGRLTLALDDLGAGRADGQRIALDKSNVRQAPTLEFHTPKGNLRIVPGPAGTRGGYDDIRRAASQEPIGKGLRVAVASTADLARMLAALGREEDMPKLVALRRLQALERKVGQELAL